MVGLKVREPLNPLFPTSFLVESSRVGSDPMTVIGFIGFAPHGQTL